MIEKIARCEECWWRRYAERKPQTLLAKIWRWHTGWCPGWKRYQKQLAEKSAPGPDKQS